MINIDKKFLLKILTVGLLFFIPTVTDAVPANQGKIIKVGISDTGFKNYYFSETNVSATDKFKITDKNTNSILGKFNPETPINIKIIDNKFSISQNNTSIANNVLGPIELSSETGFVKVVNLKRAGQPALYRGTFEITKAPTKNNQFNIINIIDLESYLRGVVPNEMPVRFGLEALKAQAVLARNYAIKPREKNLHNYDVCDSVACQVYFGANTEKELSDEAILKTADTVALHEGELILALYSSTSGGYTENYENAFSNNSSNGLIMFPGTPLPYLKGVPDNPKTPILDNEKSAREFYLSEPQTFDNDSKYFRWTKEWDRKELEENLKKTLIAQSYAGYVQPKLENFEDFGTLKNIKVSKRGVSGKAMCVEIITDKKTFYLQKELPIRRAFQKNNISLPSANVVFDIEKNNDEIIKIIAHGGGFGHGVGMSQYGAGEMAKQGYSYDEIIQHYFKNVAITTYPIILSNQNGQDVYTQTFYTKNKKTFLVIENKFQFTKMTVVINGEEFLLELVPRMFKPDRFDISEYVKKGENQITYILPYSDAHKKPVKIYVELKEATNE